MIIRFRKRKKIENHEIYPDEVMLDSRNSPKFNIQQFEGKFEKPIAKKIILFIGTFAVVFSLIIVSKLWSLQVTHGAYYTDRSTSISFDKVPVFADRGVIYDRNSKELVWNVQSENGDTFSHRAYIPEAGFSHVLGYVSYPSKDTSGIFWTTEFTGKDGLEKMYNNQLTGTNGTELVEVDVHNTIQSRHLSVPPTPNRPSGCPSRNASNEIANADSSMTLARQRPRSKPKPSARGCDAKTPDAPGSSAP